MMDGLCYWKGKEIEGEIALYFVPLLCLLVLTRVDSFRTSLHDTELSVVLLRSTREF